MNIVSNKGNKKKQGLFLASWLPAVILMIVIFAFSAKEDKASAQSSGQVTKAVVKIVEKAKNEVIKENTPLYDNIHYYVRKSAHFLEYMLLGFLLVLPYYVYGKRGLKLFLWSELTAALYACTDEFHQLFVKGRTARIMDVGIDSSGACIGVLIGMLFFCIAYKIMVRAAGARRL